MVRIRDLPGRLLTVFRAQATVEEFIDFLSEENMEQPTWIPGERQKVNVDGAGERFASFGLWPEGDCPWLVIDMTKDKECVRKLVYSRKRSNAEIVTDLKAGEGTEFPIRIENETYDGGSQESTSQGGMMK